MEKLGECKSCGKSAVREFIDYGKQPMGNLVLKTPSPKNEYFHNLKLGVCNNCWLVQQLEFPNPKAMDDMYINFAYVPVGNSPRDNLHNLGSSIYEDFNPKFVLDIGSNDGTMLKPLVGKCKVLGIEPAKEISELAKEKGIEVINDFFSDSVAQYIVREMGKPDVVTMTQVMQHLPELDNLLENVKMLLAEEGILIVEGRYFIDTLKQTSYDTSYAETVWLFTLTSLINVLKKHDLHIFRAEKVNTYGGSLRIYADRKPHSKETESIANILSEETKEGVSNFETYRAFGKKSYDLRNELQAMIAKLLLDGKSVAAYGASATSTTLLNFCGIDSKAIKYIVDESKLKEGYFTSGSHIPIVGLDYLNTHQTDYMLLTAWRLEKEIMPKIPKKTKVIIPLPEVRSA